MPRCLQIQPVVYLLIASLIAPGCSSPLFLGQSPDPGVAQDPMDFDDSDNGRVRLVGDLASPYGTRGLRVESVALVTQLGGTGSDPPPSHLREQLIKEMQTHDVKASTKTLANKSTAMVLVRGFIPPGAQKGDTFDVGVVNPPRSKTKSLRGGFLMQTRMRDHKVLGNSLREGHVMALAKGEIIVDAFFEGSEEPSNEVRGRALGAGIVQRTRPLGLYIVDDYASVKTSAAIGAAINGRFHHFDHGTKKGVANPTRDNVVELVVHPRYRNNLGRYLTVIRNIPVVKSHQEIVNRILVLERMLLEPSTSQTAALQLEAIGEDGVPALRQGALSADPEVRFYSAESLAYLDDTDAAQPLFEAARDERAFRWRALVALATLNSFHAEESLEKLMNSSSAETRYGAFRALRERNPRDPLVRGEVLDNKFRYHVVGTTGQSMVHFSRSRRAEIVVFGQDIRIHPPEFLFAGKEILIKRVDQDTLRLSRFSVDGEDRHITSSTKLDDLIRAIVKLDGGYAEVFAALEQAKSRGLLDARLEVDALPHPNRRFERQEDGTQIADAEPRFHVTNPIPDLFLDRLSNDRSPSKEDSGGEIDQPQRTKQGFFGRMTSLWTE
jgi:flagellar basal body P-ring protein FlgI